jgi:hypothetical protein
MIINKGLEGLSKLKDLGYGCKHCGHNNTHHKLKCCCGCGKSKWYKKK